MVAVAAWQQLRFACAFALACASQALLASVLLGIVLIDLGKEATMIFTC